MKNFCIFIDIIKEHLEIESLSVNAFSKKVGVSHTAIENWLKMRCYPLIKHAIKVADYFDCSLDYLFGLAQQKTFYKSASPKTFYRTFSLLLNSKSLTCYRAAKECGFQEAMLSKWKKGVYPKTETCIKLADYFHCTLEYLIGRED